MAVFCGNGELCKITEDLIFTEPYMVCDRNRWTTPQLDDIAREFREDTTLKLAVSRLKVKFMASAEALIHGDLHTGSVMLTETDTRIIDSVGQIFFEKFVKPNVFQQETDEERVKNLLENELPPTMDYLESQIGKGSETVLDTFSIADVALGAHLGGMHYAGVEFDHDRWPGVAGYAKALWARPSFAKVMGG